MSLALIHARTRAGMPAEMIRDRAAFRALEGGDGVEQGVVINRDIRAVQHADTLIAIEFVFQVSEEETVALANPEIVDRGEVTLTEDEGCLSIQGVLLPVERAAKIAIEGQDEHGAQVRYELEEPYSRVAQHESDHLDGVLILDRTTPEARREALASLRPRIVIG